MPVCKDREYRALAVTAREEEKIAEGNFSTYDEPYLLRTYDEPGYHLEVWEQVARGAFDKADASDVIMQYDHVGRVFARASNNTLALDFKIQPHMTADLGGTEIGRQLWEEIRGGYTTKMSFGFKVALDDRTRTEELVDGVQRIKIVRTIKEIAKIYDVSAVSIPANDQTEISARSYSEGVLEDVLKEFKAERSRERERLALKIKLLED